jgi:hypothetical protein
LFAEQAKERQLATLKQNQTDTVSQKIDELKDNLAPETAAVIAVEMGDNVKPDPNEQRTDQKVAKLYGTNRTYVAKAKKVQEHAPELAKKVKNKELDLNEAAKEADRHSIR